MKSLSLILALAAVPACAKKNDVATLKHEAVTLAKYYGPKLDLLDQRVQAIFQRGTSIPAGLPGVDQVGQRLAEARDLIVQMRGIVGEGPDKKSAVERQAEAAAKDRKVADLEKLVVDTHTTLDRGLTVVHGNLAAVDSWIAQYDRGTLALPAAAAPAQPTGQPPTGTEGGQPAPAQPAPAQPGAQPAPAQPAPAQPGAQPAPAQPAPAQPGR